ncbi:MAG: hypothetical protein ABDH23_00065 [Endomicrobiia bacterium]
MIKFLLFNRIVKFFYGIVLVPFCFVLLKVLVYVVSNIEFRDKLVIFFFAGMGSYLLLHLFFYKPIKMYVIGHELVHVLSSYLCGAKVRKLKIGKFSGYVSVNKINTFTALSPYFIPFYSLTISILWVVFRYILGMKIPVDIFVFLLGFSIMFHLVLTFHAVSIGQSDFRIGGWLFSLVIIFIVNCLILVFLLYFLFPSRLNFYQLKNYFLSTLDTTYKFFYFKFKNLIPFFVKSESK